MCGRTMWSLSEGFIMGLVVPAEHLRLSRLKHDLCNKTFVHPASLISYCSHRSVDLLSSAALRRIVLYTRQIQ